MSVVSTKPNLHRYLLTLDVIYDLGDEKADALKQRLYHIIERAIGEGLLTSDTVAEVDQCSIHVTEFPEVDEESMIDFLALQMEDGRIHPSEVPSKLVRYGLMDPDEFAIMMQERMEMAEEDLESTTLNRCDACGDEIECIIGCPGGLEICQSCFDKGVA